MQTRRTGIDGGNSTLNDDSWKAVETGQSIDDLLKSRKLGNHIQEQCYQAERTLLARDPKILEGRFSRQDTQIQCCYNAISLPRPFCENKSFRAFPPDYRPKEAKYKQWQGGGQGVYNQALYSSNGSYLRVGEENSRSKGCRGQKIGLQSAFVLVR